VRCALLVVPLGWQLVTACGGSPQSTAEPEPTAMRRISRAALTDKIRGGWAAQMIGVSFGEPTEFKFRGAINETDVTWQPELIERALHQDDLYVDMTFAAVIDRAGLDATTADYGGAFKNSQYPLWHANAAARRLLNLGVEAPLSSDPRHNVHANDIDFQIESDFIGLMTPGLPAAANTYCERIGRVINYGDGLYGGMFIAGMYSAAFFENEVEKIVKAGLRAIPEESGYARIVRSVIHLWRRYPTDWRSAWRELNERWDKDDQCPEGAFRDFNIDARLNGAYVAMGLLYGGGDFAKTMELTMRFGQDSDCNPASAAGVLGVVLGYSGIPDLYKAGLPPLADRKFDYTNYSFNDISRSSLNRALELVIRAGGKVEGEDVLIPVQSVTPPALEQWHMGVPVARFPIDEVRGGWALSGTWTEGVTPEDEWLEVKHHKASHKAGNVAELAFAGTAVAVAGLHGPDGGRADVFLDGRPVAVIDAYAPDRTTDMGLWHTYDLADGRHELRIVTRDDADPRSTGKELRLTLAVSYRDPGRSGR
jgi:hypothetical protein